MSSAAREVVGHVQEGRSVRGRVGRGWRHASAVAALMACVGSVWAQDVVAVSDPGADEPPTVLAFKDVTIDELLPFIVEATGKVVMPQNDVLRRKVTVFNDREIPRRRALDLVFLTLHQAGIAVIEHEDTILLRDIAEIDRADVPVIGSDESVLDRTDVGVMAQKVFTLYNSTAKSTGAVLKDNLPSYAKLLVDEESNRVAVMANIGLLQRMERLINAIDQSKAGALVTETFVLRYADATAVAQNIEDLYAADDGGSRQNQNNFQPWMRGGGQEEGTSEASSKLRASANTQQNSVTVVAEPGIMLQVKGLIAEYWDKPLASEAVVPKVYDLKNSDAVKVRDLLQSMFGSGSPGGGTGSTGTTGGGTNAARRAGQNQGTSAPEAGQGVGRLAGQFSFEAIADANRLVVVAKTPDNLEVIDRIIRDLDQPQTAGLPTIVELKHAQAEELAEQLNALLALEGTLAQIPRQESGLSEAGATGASPFSSEATTTTGADGSSTTTQSATNNIQFWWQRSRPPTTESPTSNLVGQIRLVPVWRQNALMVLAPPQYKASIVQLLGDLDRPGRQVLIKAVIAEVASADALAFGLRWSNQALTTTNPDTALGATLGLAGTANNIASSLFDTSTLEAGVDVNLLLQALDQNTAVSILSEPRIFTSDNQEAEFFDGQDIPFITDSQVTNQGNTIQSFDYRAVGIQLRVRPRITVKREVDLRVNLELSSITPGQTLLGGFIVDRRETTTQLIVKDGQTVVISGILRSEDADIIRKLPLLGDIPLLGHLFRSVEKSTNSTELLVFITPVVVDNTEETEATTANELDWLRQHRERHPTLIPESQGGPSNQ